MSKVLRDYTKPAPIAFATCDGHSALDRREPLVAFASVDVSGAEASAILGRMSCQRGASAVAAGESPPPFSEEALDEVLSKADGRFLVGFLDRRPFIETVVTDLVFAPAWPEGQDNEIRTGVRSRFRAAVQKHLSDGRRFAPAIGELEHVLSHGRPSAFLDLLNLQPDPELAALLSAKQGAIMDHWERHRPASLVSLVDVDAASLAFHAHQHEWGRRHRLIATTCSSASFPEARIASPRRFGASSWQDRVFTWHGPFRDQGHWEQWRESGETSFSDVGTSAALRLAELLACAAVHAKGVDEASGKEVRARLLFNYYGPEPVSETPEIKGHTERRNEECADQISYRENRWYFACEQDTRLPDPLRLSHRIRGADPHAARDRLMLKLLGSGLGVGAITPLRIEALAVDRFNDLFDLAWSEEMPILKMDRQDAADLWDLVLENETTEGYLFSPLENGEPYGRRGLSRAELDAIVDARLAEYPIREDVLA